MKKIQQLRELLALKSEIQKDIADYLETEFWDLYEYLSNGEKVEDFILPYYQAMIILEDTEELNQLMINEMEIEFKEEVILKSLTILRIGIMNDEDIQLHYFKS
ncbi:hypothetical protein G4D61_01100 [Bacillus ginsengihumi]|uniref:Uncharacterized protein n=1 Tax=Heyndrickxia ginsengihumi TaxID=363870 RepID=A0A6M0P1Q7_9BACI|nr:hypothetical protein [Heyndrickxia ginsengihumi]NEY18566.1 hypothetical protein [Heyndrickxia ginsengihumi]